MEDISLNMKHSTVENITFSDHDAERIVIEKNAANFHTIPKTPIYDQGIKKLSNSISFIILMIVVLKDK